jgi:hypothetical protein
MNDDCSSVTGYLARAAQIRADALKISDSETKQALLRIAESYESLAKRVAKARADNL